MKQWQVIVQAVVTLFKPSPEYLANVARYKADKKRRATAPKSKGALARFIARWAYCLRLKEMRRRRRDAEPYGYWAVVRAGWVSPANYAAFIERLHREAGQQQHFAQPRAADPGALDAYDPQVSVRKQAVRQLRPIREVEVAANRLPRRVYMATDQINEAGKWCRFEYVDADGVITQRHVVNWERRGRYVVGFDRDRQAVRTFRCDRICEWIAG